MPNPTTHISKSGHRRQHSFRVSMRFLPLMWVIALTAVFCGCAGPDVLFLHDYPNRWPHLQTTDGQGCLLLSGDYRYLGETGYPDNQPGPRLPTFEATALFRPLVAGIPTNVRLRQNIEGGSLTATIELKWPSWAAGTRSKQVTISRDNFRCADGWTTWVRVFSEGNGESGLHYGSESLRLSLAVDRSLIVQHAVDEEIWFGLFKKRRRGTAWFRFESTAIPLYPHQ